jgi:hypothetical protein
MSPVKMLLIAFLKQYGSVYKTHRLFRQYLLAAVLPSSLGWLYQKRLYYYHIDHLWTVHSKRLNQRILDDPSHSFYPKELLEPLRNF